MASVTSDITIRFDEEQLQRLERVGTQFSRRTLADVAFQYLLSKATCTCVDQSRSPQLRIHDDQCVIAKAIEIREASSPPTKTDVRDPCQARK
jgi:hypothetical protein